MATEQNNFKQSFVKHADHVYQNLKSKQCSFKILTAYENIKYGLARSWEYQCQIKSDLAKTHVLADVTLQHTNHVPVVSCTITSADLDPVENKYLLVGRGDGTLSIYDTSYYKAKKGMFGHIGTTKDQYLPHQIDCVQWYPVDAGLFTTTSSHRPNCINVWDPNSFQKVDEFILTCRVHHHHMSPVASKHSLLAAAAATGEVILCDLRTGSSTHRVHGHEGPVAVVQWTRHNPNHLASGGHDGTIRIWDVRSGRACLKVLNTSIPVQPRKKKKASSSMQGGMITSLTFSHDGLWLVSYSANGKLKIWNTHTYESKKINYGTGFSYRYNSLKKSIPVAITKNLYPDLIFVPSRCRIFVYEITTGDFVNALEGHFDIVYGTIYNSTSGDVYSYGADHKFLVWTPRNLFYSSSEDVVDKNMLNGVVPLSNLWSSDED